MVNPKKAKNVGIGQFRRQGVAHTTQPGSAAALLSQKIADQRLQEWLRGKAEREPVEVPKSKAKSKRKRKGKNAAEEEKTEGDTPAEAWKDGKPAFKGKKGQEEAAAAAENDTAKKAKQDSVSTVVTAPVGKLNQTGTYTSSRRLTASSGPWGKQIVENAMEAAPMATATAYEDVTTMAAIEAAARALAAAAEAQRQSQSASQRDIPIRSIVESEFAPAKTASKSAARTQGSRRKEKVQPPMWSDHEDNDTDKSDFENINPSSKSTKSNPKTTRRQTTASSRTKRKTALGKKKGVRVQSTPQRNTVRSAVSSTESDDKIDKSSRPQKSSKPSSKKQIPRMSAPSTFNPSSSDPSSNRNINVPTTPNQPLDQGELSDDDEASELLKDPANSPSKPIHSPIPQYQPPPPRPAPAAKGTPPKQQRPDPSHKKGVARKPEPKRTQASSSSDDSESDAPTSKRVARKRKWVVSSDESSDNSDNSDNEETGKTSSPANKKAKTSSEKPQPQKEQAASENGPLRKKGVASKPVQRERAPQY
jgi:hypothetical protein